MQREAHRLQVALTARTQLRAYLVSLGARERPPMPELVAESPGSAPFAGAVWVAGHWTWSSGQWQWTWDRGGWVDGTVSFGASGGADGAVMVDASQTTTVIDTSSSVIVNPGVSIGVGVPVDTRPVVVDHRTETRPVRDHREPVAPPVAQPPRNSPPTVRDHREPVAQPPRNPPRQPAVRDHRDEPKRESKVRDHR
jgi:hypothetical protein